MLRRLAQACVPTVMVAAVLAAGGLTAEPATAGTSSAGVTVFLTAPDLAGLKQLASAHGLSHDQRIARLRKLLPSARQHAEAVSALRAEGLTVTRETAWTVSATGSSADVTDAFGTHAVAHARSSAAQRRAADAPYPTLPASLRGVASVALPTYGPAEYHRNDGLDGTDFRNAYTTPDRTSHGLAPFSGQDPAATLTIATIQLGWWNPNDLAHWAGENTVSYDAAQDLSMVPVDQADIPTTPADSSDDSDVETDLDQEAILSTDPYAHQRPYFAPNGGSGYMDAIAQVVDDVTQDANAYGGGDSHIVALSTSWGLCESDNGDTPADAVQAINAMETEITSLLAAGVTMFASSGDDGIYDCLDGSTGVDYPASSPEVVGVGGTQLDPLTATAPNDGTNWQENAWSCSDPTSCSFSGNGGSGGGASSTFAKPSYQSVLNAAPYASSTDRLVPDIAADGDPATGLAVYTSDPVDGPGDLLVGGTSLAAPLSAALFTNALAAHAVTAGVGDIHDALYTAYATQTNAFRDVTIGDNGAAADAGSDPSVDAGAGYDTVTGLGAPLWPTIASDILTPVAPTATAALRLTNVHSTSSPDGVTASWTSTPASSSLPLAKVTVRITRVGQSAPVYSTSAAPANGSYHFTGAPGASFVVTVTALDSLGTPSKPATSTVQTPIDDKHFHFSGLWHRTNNGGDVGGSDNESSQGGASATVSATGKAYSLVVRTGPSFGKLVIKQGASIVKTVNLHASSGGTKRVTFFTAGSVAARTFKFVRQGGKVDVDAVYVGQ